MPTSGCGSRPRPGPRARRERCRYQAGIRQEAAAWSWPVAAPATADIEAMGYGRRRLEDARPKTLAIAL